MSLAWGLYRALAPCVGAVLPAARGLAPAAERERWDERLGRTRLAGGADAWIHAASMGEAVAAVALARGLAAVAPGARFVLSATTRTGRERLAGLDAPAVMAPLDAPQAVARFFAGVAPKRVFVVETELWPHWLLRAREGGVPVTVVSGRLSERSVRGYLRLGAPLRELVGGLAGVLCQTEADLARWRRLGAAADRSAVTGNLKDDGLRVGVRDRVAARRALGLEPGRPLLVLGSLRPGEGRALAEAWRRLPPHSRERWQVAAVPRHPQAAAALRAEVEAAGQAVVAPDAVAAPGAWRWDERLGVLNEYYAAAEAAFVGGSLGPHGGHNPLEPAACGAALVMGPHHEAQADAARALEAAGALLVAAGGDELARALERTLGDEAARTRAGRAALAVAGERQGSVRRTLAWLGERGLWPVA